MACGQVLELLLGQAMLACVREGVGGGGGGSGGAAAAAVECPWGREAGSAQRQEWEQAAAEHLERGLILAEAALQQQQQQVTGAVVCCRGLARCA
eukprot:COSAG01_NODE_4087_length_5365_cov_5.981200_3_plen_95_part_00